MSSSSLPVPEKTRRRRPLKTAGDAPPASSDAIALRERRAALLVAAEVGCDLRTAFKALRGGLETIRQARLREALRTALARHDVADGEAA